MEVRVWRSFSCNNSSSFRLVARFKDEASAKGAADELNSFFAEHAGQMDELFGEGNFEQPTEAAKEFGKKHGFEWNDMLSWGDDSQVGDEPQVVTEGNTLLLYHSYCGGFGEDLPKYFEAKGAETTGEDDDRATISALFRLSNDASKAGELNDELTQLFAQAKDKEQKYIDNWKIKPAWSKADQEDGTVDRVVGFFSDGKTIGFNITINPTHISALKEYLRNHDVQDLKLSLCAPRDHAKFNAIAAAKCAACDSPLQYVDASKHEIPTEQLSCAKCGGMFELSNFYK